MEELKACPSQWGAAVKYLNAYRNSHYADAITEDSYWLADAINTILPFAVNAYRRAAPENSRFENCHIYEPGENIGTIAGKCEVLIKGADLQKLVAAPENNPLTLDELRRMDGEPVWVREMAVWALVATCGASIWLRFNSGDAKYISSVDGYEIYARNAALREKLWR